MWKFSCILIFCFGIFTQAEACPSKRQKISLAGKDLRIVAAPTTELVFVGVKMRPQVLSAARLDSGETVALEIKPLKEDKTLGVLLAPKEYAKLPVRLKMELGEGKTQNEFEIHFEGSVSKGPCGVVPKVTVLE